MKRLIEILFSIIFISILFADGIEGQITETETGEPIAGANVYILEMKNIGAASDIDGNFKIIGVPSGTWTLTVSDIAHKVSQETVIIEDGLDILSIDFELEPSISSMDAIVTTATREKRIASELPIRTEVVSQKVFREKNAKNVYEALENEPGIRVESQCSSCNFTMLRMSGLEGGYAQMLIDGQPIFTGLAGVYGLEQIQTGHVSTD